MPEDISPEDHLRDRLSREGVDHLTNAELLALLLKIGTKQETSLELADRLFQQQGGLRALARLEYADWLLELRPNQAAQVVAALELGRRLASATEAERPLIKNGQDVARLLGLEMERHKQEHLRVILLDIQRRVMAMPTVYIGSLDTTMVRTAEVFREAIARNAANLILVHNHPSGDPTPSPQDISLTEHLIQAGRLLDMLLVDHVIIGHGRWVSLRDVGVAF